MCFIPPCTAVIRNEVSSVRNEVSSVRNEVSRLYEKLVPPKMRNVTKQIKIPKPEFFVFYNGKKKVPAEFTMRLSESFMEPAEKDEGTLELTVKVVNINMYSDSEIFRNCKPLTEYTKLIEFINQERQNFSEDALNHAITKAIQQGILTDYLERKGSEVRNMFMVEYNYEDDIECRRAEGLAEGRAEGITEGIEQTRLETARRMLARNMDFSTIADLTDLSIEQIQSLSKEN